MGFQDCIVKPSMTLISAHVIRMNRSGACSSHFPYKSMHSSRRCDRARWEKGSAIQRSHVFACGLRFLWSVVCLESVLLLPIKEAIDSPVVFLPDLTTTSSQPSRYPGVLPYFDFASSHAPYGFTRVRNPTNSFLLCVILLAFV